MIAKKIYFLLFFNFLSPIFGWSWLYKVNPSEWSQVKTSTDVWQWEKTEVPAFSQLIFSWNAYRPKTGYYSFWAQVRDNSTKKWHDFHKMAEWGTDQYGNKIQRSLVSKKRGSTQFVYVRLELPKNKYADGFRIRIKMHNGAKIEDLKQIAINIINKKRFGSEVGSKKISNLPSIYISTVPKFSQMVLDHPCFDSLCSPTSTSMVISYLLDKQIDPCQVAEGAYDTGLGVYGSWPFNTAHAFELCKGQIYFHVERLKSFKNLHDYLKRGTPVIVSIRGPIKGSAKPYLKGHLLVVVGYNQKQKKVLCHDPAFVEQNQIAVAYSLNDFLTAWERSQRLAYIAHK